MLKTRQLILLAGLIFSELAHSQTCTILANPAIDTVCGCEALHLSNYASSPNNGLSFNGISGYLSTPSSVSLGTIANAMTISVWINVPNSTTNQKILGKTTVAFSGGYLMGLQNGSLYFELWNSTPTHYSLNVGTVATNGWVNLALTYLAGGKMFAYVNGVATDSVSVANFPVGTNTNPLIIGAAPWDISFFKLNGMVDEVRIYNSALSQAQILQEMNSQIPFNSAGLVAYYPMDEGTGAVANDLTGNGNNLSLVSSPSWLVPSTCPITSSFTYLWTPNLYINSASVPNPVFVNCVPGIYPYVVSAVNNVTNCIDSDTVTVVVQASPTVALGGDTIVCLASAPFPLTGNPAGGTFSGPGVIAGIFDPQIPNVSVDTIIYSYTNTTGCMNADTMIITVSLCNTVFENYSEKKNFLSPNPGSGKLLIDLESLISAGEMERISVRNVLGEEIIFLANPSLQLLTFEVDLSSHVPGVYFVTLETKQGGMFAQKYILEK